MRVALTNIRQCRFGTTGIATPKLTLEAFQHTCENFREQYVQLRYFPPHLLRPSHDAFEWLHVSLLVVWEVTCAYALRNFISRLARLYYLPKAVKERDFATGNASALNSGIYAPTSSLDGLRCVLAVSVIEDFGKNLAACCGKYGFKSTDGINNWTAQTAGRHGLSSAVTSGLRKAGKTYAIFCKVIKRQLSRVVRSCCKSG